MLSGITDTYYKPETQGCTSGMLVLTVSRRCHLWRCRRSLHGSCKRIRKRQ
ncbi:hypothetical protein AG1IA_06746 [Rhizoctonia solani AG-1 IA]|uniref:Uncharacterized protein n=1 Tax=Thanatephorus cucumeris (strain AG1-IA) TaxID=983506 RepID=L8WS63_THACA|nr:hypothetical protein AG1IA_06746 [Rhizoctonia solani AG-1 IA]